MHLPSAGLDTLTGHLLGCGLSGYSGVPHPSQASCWLGWKTLHDFAHLSRLVDASRRDPAPCLRLCSPPSLHYQSREAVVQLASLLCLSQACPGIGPTTPHCPLPLSPPVVFPVLLWYSFRKLTGGWETGQLEGHWPCSQLTPVGSPGLHVILGSLLNKSPE